MGSAQHRRNNNRRKARPDSEPTYDGVTDFAIYRRDGWMCQMPECLHPDSREIVAGRKSRISASLPGASGDPWRPSIDHVVPLASGGRDDAVNKRAAHQLCNEAAQEHYGRGRGNLSRTIGDEAAPQLVALRDALAGEQRLRQKE